MPRLTMETSHALGREEALTRVKGKIDELKQTHRDAFGDLHEQWDGDTLSFGFRAVGMQVKGTATVEDSGVKLAAELPFAAMMFKGKIEQGIRDELDTLLA